MLDIWGVPLLDYMFKYAMWMASDARSWPQALTAPHRAPVKGGIARTRTDIKVMHKYIYIMLCAYLSRFIYLFIYLYMYCLFGVN